VSGPLLHLDAARFGLAPLRVRSALAALAEFGGSEGLSAGLDVLLRGGFSSWPAGSRARYPGLANWEGVEELGRELAFLLAPGPAGGQTFLASRASLLMRSAARVFARRCRSVLATDLAWPGYLGILGEELSRASVGLVHLPLLSAILFDKLSARGVAERVSSAYRGHGCDGLFLPAASHHGVHMPLGPIRDRLEGLGLQPRFSVVDAAQVPGHLPPDPECSSADFVIAGCHKWLGSLQTLGVGVAPRPPAGNGNAVEAITAEARGLDPLFDFLEGVRSGRTEPFGETVGLAPLFTARAALAALASGPDPGTAFANRLANVALASQAGVNADWTPICLHPSVRSGILLLRARSRADRRTPGGVLRERFLGRGVVLTAYDGGFVRLSMPGIPLRGEEIDLLARAFRGVQGVGRGSSYRMKEAYARSPRRKPVDCERSAAVTT
jgi:hypothetical protein